LGKEWCTPVSVRHSFVFTKKSAEAVASAGDCGESGLRRYRTRRRVNKEREDAPENHADARGHRGNDERPDGGGRLKTRENLVQ